MKKIFIYISILFVLLLNGCMFGESENSNIYEDIEYDMAFHYSHKGGETYYMFDNDSDICWDVGKNQIHKNWSAEQITYSIDDYGNYHVYTKNGEIIFWMYEDHMKVKGTDIIGYEFDKCSVSRVIDKIKEIRGE